MGWARPGSRDAEFTVSELLPFEVQGCRETDGPSAWAEGGRGES